MSSRCVVLATCLSLALIGLVVPAMSAKAEETPAHVAVVPAPRPDKWWTDRHAQKLEQKAAMGKVDLVLIGDSITHGWENAGQAVFAKYYAERNTLNLGYSGDRTEHVLWRLANGEVDGISPKLVVMMIGTNNIGHGSSSPAQTIDGIRAILADLEKRLPEARVLLLAVFPRGATVDDPLRRKTVEINSGLPALADGKRVHFLDINGVFLDDDGTLPKTVMPDLLHPNTEGYRLWAEAVEPRIAELLSPN